jgi:hypothetical protein
MLKRPLILFAALLLAAILVGGLVRLFDLRFEKGDFYPRYSTLRTDPLGASVLYESLDDVPGVTAQRYFEETFKQEDGRAQALFVLGAPAGPDTWLSRSEFDTLQHFVASGGRVVIAYHPQVGRLWTDSTLSTNGTEPSSDDFRPRHRHRPAKSQPHGRGSETNRPAGSSAVAAGTNGVAMTNAAAGGSQHRSRYARRHAKAGDDQGDQDGRDDEELKDELHHYAELSAEWGFAFQFNQLETNDDGELQFPKARLVASGPALPALLPIHTAWSFTNLTNGWFTVYERGQDMPVVIERKIGAGSVVLVADAYPFSNQALFKERSAPLLAWFLGSGRDAIFDEAHLGIAEEPGIATLMRRYRLHGLILSLVLLAGLFVWKNAYSLVPAYTDPDAAGGPVVTGRDSGSGLINLVRRGVPRADLINVCYAEWKKSNARLAGLSPAQRRDVEQLIQQQAALPPRLRKPVENYRVLAQIIRRRH